MSHDPTIRGNVKYICGTAEDLVRTEDEAFDALVCSEVLEHVSHKENFIKTCAELVKVNTRLQLLFSIKMLLIFMKNKMNFNKISEIDSNFTAIFTLSAHV